MGRVLHGSATNTHSTKKEMREVPKKVSNYVFLTCLGLYVQTAKKWRNRLEVGTAEPLIQEVESFRRSSLHYVSVGHETVVRQLFICVPRLYSPLKKELKCKEYLSNNGSNHLQKNKSKYERLRPSKTILSVISMLTKPKSTPRKDRSICSLLSTAHRKCANVELHEKNDERNCNTVSRNLN